MSQLLVNNSAIVHAIGWTILHSLWQGLFLFCLLKIVLRFITLDRAKLRYNISLAVLSAQAVWIVNTFVNQIQAANSYVVKNIVVAPSMYTTNTLAVASTANNSNNSLQTAMLWIDKNTSIIVVLYIIGIALLTARLVYNLFAIKRVKNNSQYSNNILWNNILNAQAKRLGIKRRVDLLISKNITTPMVMGMFKPVILLPIATINNLTTEQLEAILLHELAHIKRHDYLVNIIQTVLETILFYNPFVWLISKTIRIEREHSCDDIVVSSNAENKVPYANALATIAVNAQNAPQTTLAATGNKYQLLNRIKRIIEMKKSPITKVQVTAVIVLVLSIVLSITLISPTLSAQTKEEKKEKPKKKKKVTTHTRTISLASEKITITDDEGNSKTYTKLEDVPQEDREKLQNTFGKNTTVYYGPQKKVIVKTNGSYDIKVLNASADEDVDLDVEIEELGEEFGKKVSVAVLTALNEVDWEELGTSLQDAMKGIGEAVEGSGEAMNEVGNALESVNWTEIREEINTALEDMSPEEKEQLKQELAKAKVELKVAMARAKEDMHTVKKEIIIQKRVASQRHNEAMAKHDEAMAKHKEAMNGHRAAMAKHKEAVKKHKKTVAKHGKFDDMLKMMDKDGLIDKDGKYIIEKKGKRDLYIDGIKQSAEVYNKYKKYLTADELLIKGKKNSLTITVKDN